MRSPPRGSICAGRSGASSRYRREIADWTDTLDVFCADIGSVPSGNFAWARRIPGQGVEPHAPASIAALGDEVIKLLAEGKPVALGFETPLFVPVPEDPKKLAKARPADAGAPAWSGTPGATALAQALVQVPWLLRRIHAELPEIPAFFDWESFADAQTGLLLWEAFVSGEAKGGSHEKDAAAGVTAFCDQLPDVGDAIAFDTPSPFSLVAAAAMWAGFAVEVAALRVPCVLVRAKALLAPGHPA